MLSGNTQLFAHHIDTQQGSDFAKPVTEVTRDSVDLLLWRLKNLSKNKKWLGRRRDGSDIDVEPGRSIDLAKDTKIQVGAAELTIFDTIDAYTPIRPLHFIWICDCSSSTANDGKIESLNHAIRAAIPHIRAAAATFPRAEVFVRAVKFSDEAPWHIPRPTPVADFVWTDLSAGGITGIGKALAMVAEELKTPPMPLQAYHPVLVLITDGQPTDDFASGLKALMDEVKGVQAVRVAITIGKDADNVCLQMFLRHPELTPLQANHPMALETQIQWIAKVAIGTYSSPVSQVALDREPPSSLGNDIW